MKQLNVFGDDNLDNHIEEICKIIKMMRLDDQIDALNRVRLALHEAGPFRDQPVDCVLWVENDKVSANDYNPNKVAPPEMRLLVHSIDMDGMTQPVVTHRDNGGYEVVDGFHRTRVCREKPKVRERLNNYIPITIINEQRTNRNDRIAATIRHNRARGVHGVVPLVDIVAELIKRGWNDEEVAKELGMDADEVLRFKQSSGLPELFKDDEYSKSWE